MGTLAALLGIALSAHVVSIDDYPLRRGCAPDEPVVAHLKRGDPVEIRFRLAGSGGGCYKVRVQSGEQVLEGYVSADALSDVEAFDEARRAAPVASAPAIIRAEGSGVVQSAAAGGAQDLGARAAQLIQENRPREALNLLERAIRSAPRDPGLLSLAGFAAYRADHARLAVEYWEEALALKPNPSVRRMYEAAKRELEEDRSGRKLFGTRFALRYNPGQMKPETARRIVAMLEQEWSRIAMELGCRTEERIVAIVQTPEEYRRTTDAAEWSAGQYNGRIRVAASDQTRLDERTRRIFAHELVHACLAGLGKFPVWLHEGLAQKLSGERLGAYEREMVRRMAAQGQLPRLENLSQTWARMSPLHAKVAYSTALMAIELFLEEHPALGARNLVHNPNLVAQMQQELDRRLQSLQAARR